MLRTVTEGTKQEHRYAILRKLTTSKKMARMNHAMARKLIKAIEFKNKQLMMDLLEGYHGSLNMKIDREGNNLLNLAAMQMDQQMLEILLSKGIDVNW